MAQSRVTCDFRFSDLVPGAAPTFGTHSQCQSTRYGTEPWADTLASCVRCHFGSANESGDGLLQAGVKLEKDLEIANISWSSFSEPTPRRPTGWLCAMMA